MKEAIKNFSVTLARKVWHNPKMPVEAPSARCRARSSSWDFYFRNLFIETKSYKNKTEFNAVPKSFSRKFRNLNLTTTLLLSYSLSMLKSGHFV
jgi:hypothetical protein